MSDDMHGSDWMIYGATGYTGRLIAREAVARGHRPVLAGRDAKAVERLARKLGTPHRVFSLDQMTRIAGQVQGMQLVLHCAGPFSATSAPMRAGCIAARTHYLDITGEIAPIEAAAAEGLRASAAGVMLLPAVGFDVVPSDCLAAMLKQRLPSATHLALAFHATGGVSRGTAKTAVESLKTGVLTRVDGKIATWRRRPKSMSVPFPCGGKRVTLIPWGDVASAYYSTGIPNIETYAAIGRFPMTWIMPLVRRLARSRRIRRRMVRWVERKITGPSDDELASSRACLWGRATDGEGRCATAVLETPGAYRLTVDSALACVERALAGGAKPGFMTPSLAFGAELVLSLPNVRMKWLDT